MNRTIKFRGKVLHRKSRQKNEWIYGMPTIFREGRAAIRWQCSEKAKDPEAWKTQSVKPETLGQFTGLLDKNGKEIYEGDIFTVNGKYPKLIAYRQEYAGFCMANTDELKRLPFIYIYPWIQIPSEWWNDHKREIMIIGNIHDHPELLYE